jgi:hypothetical protein
MKHSHFFHPRSPCALIRRREYLPSHVQHEGGDERVGISCCQSFLRQPSFGLNFDGMADCCVFLTISPLIIFLRQMVPTFFSTLSASSALKRNVIATSIYTFLYILLRAWCHNSFLMSVKGNSSTWSKTGTKCTLILFFLPPDWNLWKWIIAVTVAILYGSRETEKCAPQNKTAAGSRQFRKFNLISL